MFPKIFMIEQKLTSNPIQDLRKSFRRQLNDLDIFSRIGRNSRIGITAGSRGIRNIDSIFKELVSFLCENGAQPFLFPAMGSHGGANADGQAAILRQYGISEEAMGIPILSSMETVCIGKTVKGLDVVADLNACKADYIIVINRIKPHTKFKGDLESGLCKMMTIGMGKHKGAKYYHSHAIKYGFAELIESVATIVMQKLPILFGVGIVEDAYEQTSIIEVIPPDRIIQAEKILLRQAKEYLPKLPFKDIDVLIIDKIGKEISGAGMDFNVIGRNRDVMNRWNTEQKIKRLFVRDLTDHSKGNGLGIGMADFTTDRLVNKLDPKVMYINALTASGPQNAAIPMHFPTDKMALEACLTTIGPISKEEVKLVWIRDTLSLQKIIISEYLTKMIPQSVSIVGGKNEIQFDLDDNLISPLK
jgi:hypothetical protein